MTISAEQELAAGRPRRSALANWPTVRRLLGHKAFLIGAVLFGITVFLAISADLITTVDPNRLAVRNRFKPPSFEHLFGTDNVGRSQFSRIAYGARLSLLIGIAVVLLNAVFGVLLGAAAGYFRKLDNILMRIADSLMAFPAVLLAIAIASALGPSSLTAAIALSVVYIPRTARVVRASVLVVREMEYVQAATALGASHARIVFKHILPNCLAPLIVQLTFVFAYAVLSEAVLSFLGLGAAPPTPTWGNIIAEGRDYIREATWITLIPGAFLAMTVLGLNLLGDALRDVLDPRLNVIQG
jgi:peptide/nickel transport system permease protein